MTKKEKIGEIVRYLIVGVLTTIISLIVYYGLVYTILNPENGIELQIANVVSWVISVIFAYVTNRIFVFKSKEEKKLKEISKFFGSRIVTLLMDMAIMFVGVTILRGNDKIFKLVSQVVVIISNYVLSKLFVFQKKATTQKKKKSCPKWLRNIEIKYLYLLPLLPICSIITNETTTYIITIGYFTILFLYFFLTLWYKKESRFFLIFLLSYLLIGICYFIAKETPYFENSLMLIGICFFFVSTLYFINKKERISETILPTLFFETIIIAMLFFKELPLELLQLSTVTLPFAIIRLKKHQNYLTKYVGFMLLLFFLIIYHLDYLCILSLIILGYTIIKEKNLSPSKKVLNVVLVIAFLGTTGLCWYTELSYVLKNELSLDTLLWQNHSNEIVENTSLLIHANIEEQLFGINGIESIPYQKTDVDIAHIIFSTGIIGSIVYLFSMIYILKKVKWQKENTFLFIMFILYSLWIGNVFTSAFSTIILGMMLKQEKPQKKILIVSNMYPSKKFKHYGSFVKNSQKYLEEIGYLCNIVYLKKHANRMIKYLSYIPFYSKAFLKSLFISYDVYYIHFVSHSSLPVLLGKLTGETSLICNVHGNDLVSDSKKDWKNKFFTTLALSHSTLVISPSHYFKEILEKEYHLPEEKIRISPSGGVDTEKFKKQDKKEAQEKLGLEKDMIYLGMISRIEKDKGWDTLLEAFSLLQNEKYYPKMKLIIIGTGEEQKQFTAKIKELKLEEKVMQKNFVSQEELVTYYNAFDALIFPTRRKSESLGLVGLEAMACQTLVIGCTLYGPKEYLRDKENSLAYSKDDKELLAKKIKEFMALTTKEKEKMVKKMQETVKKYDANTVKEELQKIFH